MRALPPGLRAMTAIYQLDVSMALDDLGWHFGNWPDRALREETLQGLKEFRGCSTTCLLRHSQESVPR
jgi:hypothetical protein